MELFPHQKKAVEEFLKTGRMILHASTGVGKTPTALIAAKTVAPNGPVLYLCPAILKEQVKEEAEKWTDFDVSLITGTKKQRDDAWLPGSDFYVANFELLLFDFEKMLHIPWEMIIVDECFPYETPVMTNIGEIPIGKIVEENLDVKVLSYDFDKNTIVYKDIVRRIHLPKRIDYVMVTAGNHKIKCTSNHKIYVEGKGYVQAKNIKEGMDLLVLQDNFSHNTIKKEKVLWSKLCCKAQNGNTEYQEENLRESRTTEKAKCVYEKEMGGEQSSENKNYREDEQRQESDEICKCTKKSISQDERKMVSEGKRWERATNIRTSDESLETSESSRGVLGACSNNKNCEASLRETSERIQGGCSNPLENASNRSRWYFSWNLFRSRKRQEKRCGIKRVRVESVEIEEQRSDGELGSCRKEIETVYNLEVEGTHNYFANRVLVSNCHKLKTPTSKTYKKFIKLRSRYRLAMSGTLMPNALHEAWAMASWMVPGIFRESFSKFKRMDCIVNEWHGIECIRDEDAFREKLNPIVHRIKREDAIELPPIVEKRFECKMGKKQRVAYDTLRKELEIEIGTEKLTVTNILSMLMRLRQITDDPGVLGLDVGNAKKELLRNLLDSISSRKIIIFAELKSVLRSLHKEFGGNIIDGDTRQKNRDEILKSFKDDPDVRILFLSSAGEHGLNIQCSDTVIHYSLPWNFARVDQREARAYRHGQKKTVTTYRLIVENSVDESMEKLVEKKRKLTTDDLIQTFYE